MKPAAKEVDEPQSIQQKSMHHKNETAFSKKSEYRNACETRSSHIIQQKVGRSEVLKVDPGKDHMAEFRCMRGDAHTAVQEMTDRHRDQEPHSGGGSLTANNDYAVTECHTVVLKTSPGHAVAESQRPDKSPHGQCNTFL